MFGYENIGGKIKRLVTALFALEAVGSIIVGIFVFIGLGIEKGWWGIALALLGPLVAWVLSWFLYGFGELIEKTAEIAENTRKNPELSIAQPEANKNTSEPAHAESPAEEDDGEYVDVVCPKCGKTLYFDKNDEEYECPFCGCKFN